MAAPKLHSHFSIDNILRKEQHSKPSLVENRLESSISDVDDENSLRKWRKDLLAECSRDCCGSITKDVRDELPVLQSRHKLTEYWVYENQRQLPTLFPTNTFPPPPTIVPAKRPSYSSSSDLDFIPSPSRTPRSSSWSSPPHHPHPLPPPARHAKGHSLDYWFLERMNHYRRSSMADHPYYWNSSSAFIDERNGFSSMLGRPRMKSSLSTLNDNDSDEGNRKGGQVRFTHTQSTELERVFSLQKYVSPQERKQLARSIDLSERQVKTWFQNRRAKWRRIKLEDEMRVRMTSENTSLANSIAGKLHETHDVVNQEENATTILKQFENNETDLRYHHSHDDVRIR